MKKKKKFKKKKKKKKKKTRNYYQLPSNIFNLQRLKDFKINGSFEDLERDCIWDYSIWDYRIYIAYIVYYFILSNQEWEDVRIFGRWNLCQGCRFITPWNCLRSYLESKLKLTVVSLIQITRNHFREKDTLSFFTEIRNAFQFATESPHDFVFRLREKMLIFANGGLPLRWKFIPSLFASCYFYWSREWQYQQVMYATTP